jgi:hydrogenase nickel incorporation protein HypA/HybF
MHELPVTEQLLAVTLEKARAAGAGRVTEVHLVIGQLSSFVDDSISFYWDILSEGTLAEGAELCFQRIPAEMRCLDCRKSYQPAPGELLCPTCGGARVEVQAGDEFLLDYIMIDEADPNPINLESVV